MEGLTDIIYDDKSIIADNKIEDLPIQVVVDGYTFEINEKGNVTLVISGPKVEDNISPDTQIGKGEKITITVTATPIDRTIITKITLPDGTEKTNVSEVTFEVTENDDYEFIIEGSNGGKTIHTVTITNGIEGEKFSNIYTETKPYTDEKGKTARIPEGFAVGESSKINTIENGLVITDAIDEKHRSIGNEFVWVPVDDANNFKRVDGYREGSKQDWVSRKIVTEPYSDGNQEEKDLYNTMKNSVTNESNKGFYIGRYEAGKDTDGSVVSKKNMPVYNNIGWSNSDTMTVLTGGAAELSKNFVKTTYTDKAKTVGVTSTLVYGIQWDAAMQFFDDNYINGTPSSSSYIKNSIGKGWYLDNSGKTFHNTGIDIDANESNKIKNIYDMAGNVHEWTMEAYDNIYRVYRGGYYNNDGSKYPISSCTGSLPTYSRNTVGFRLALYVNV